MRVKIEKWGRVTGGRVSEWRWVKTTRVLFLIGPGCPQRGAANERERERDERGRIVNLILKAFGGVRETEKHGGERERDSE